MKAYATRVVVVLHRMLLGSCFCEDARTRPYMRAHTHTIFGYINHGQSCTPTYFLLVNIDRAGLVCTYLENIAAVHVIECWFSERQKRITERKNHRWYISLGWIEPCSNELQKKSLLEYWSRRQLNTARSALESSPPLGSGGHEHIFPIRVSLASYLSLLFSFNKQT